MTRRTLGISDSPLAETHVGYFWRAVLQILTFLTTKSRAALIVELFTGLSKASQEHFWSEPERI